MHAAGHDDHVGQFRQPGARGRLRLLNLDRHGGVCEDACHEFVGIKVDVTVRVDMSKVVPL